MSRVPSPVPASTAGVPVVGIGPVLRDGSPLVVRIGDPGFPVAMVYDSDAHYRAVCRQSVADWNHAHVVALRLQDLGCEAADARAVMERVVAIMTYSEEEEEAGDE